MKIIAPKPKRRTLTLAQARKIARVICGPRNG